MPFFNVHSVVPIASFKVSFLTGEPFNAASFSIRGTLTTLSLNGSISAATAAFKASTNSVSVGTATPSFLGELTTITKFFKGSYICFTA